MLGTEVAPTDVGGEKMAGSFPQGERTMVEDVEAPRTEGCNRTDQTIRD